MILIGDNLDIMRTLPDGCVNLIMTSPPYADARKNTYGGVKPDEYVEWFLPRAEEMYRVLANDGSFVLNIKERTYEGERLMYVLDLVYALRNQGWRWTEEYIWFKTNPIPGNWPDRFRDAWERLYHFTKIRKFKINRDAVRVPPTEGSAKRMSRLGAYDLENQTSKTGSGFSRNMSRYAGKDLVYPTNVISGMVITAKESRGHSAQYPEYLPEFFIKLFTNERDLVLDPFVGSGTTCRAAERLCRNAIGIDLVDPATLTTGEQYG